MAGDLRIPGQPNAGTNNPLLILAEAIDRSVAGPLERLARAAELGASAHEYAVAIADIPQHGRVWGAYCMSCSAQAQTYVYPCENAAEGDLMPPRFFTVGKALEPRGDGAFLVTNDPAVPGGGELRVVPPTP